MSDATNDEAQWLDEDVVTPPAAANPMPAADAWMRTVVADAMQVDPASIPREMMWARIRQQRSAHAPRSTRRPVLSRAVVNRVMAVAATLLVGVAIGRYGLTAGPRSSDLRADAETATVTASRTAAQGTMAQAADAAGAPAVVAMEEHLAHTVALLVTVRDGTPDALPGAGLSGWARELLGTTRMLLDEPSLRDDRTRRLLQDLELVLVQVVQARGAAAPEARRAPSETMRETNLLPRVRAAATASISSDETTFRGIAE